MLGGARTCSHSSEQQLGSGRNGENAAGNAAGTEQAGRATAGRESFMPAARVNAGHVTSGRNVNAGHIASGHNVAPGHVAPGHVTAGRDTFALPGNQTTSRAYATEPGVSAQRPPSEMEAMVRQLMREYRGLTNDDWGADRSHTPFTDSILHAEYPQ